VKFERAIEKGITHVKCDADRIEQVINSIFETGIMGSVKGDGIQVSVARAQDPTERHSHVQCRVTHTGRAFSSDEINQVLNASEKEWKKINSSIAIGTYNLAISRRILEAQGGTLRVEGLEKKTTVEFTLPLV
jgi:signal transduction histidine kinase